MIGFMFNFSLKINNKFLMLNFHLNSLTIKDKRRRKLKTDQTKAQLAVYNLNKNAHEIVLNYKNFSKFRPKIFFTVKCNKEINKHAYKKALKKFWVVYYLC